MLYAVHGGACTNYLPKMTQQCANALSHQSVVDSIAEMEDSVLFNCGYGSSLTIDGNVECEASYMSSEGLRFGAIGAINNVKNPIKVAHHLTNNQWWKSRNLLHPLILVGNGASQYAIQNDFQLCEPEFLISEKAKSNHQKYLNSVVQNESSDTVGGICIQTENMKSEACASSGGIALKHAGRLGHSCIYGSGIWSEKRVMDNGDSRCVAVCSSGHGEYLVQADFCRAIGRLILNSPEESIPIDIIRNFLRSNMLPESKYGGIAIVSEKCDNNLYSEFLLFHNCSFFPCAVRNSEGRIKKFSSIYDCNNTNGDNFIIQSIIL